jgi:hypothetical protein
MQAIARHAAEGKRAEHALRVTPDVYRGERPQQRSGCTTACALPSLLNVTTQALGSKGVKAGPRGLRWPGDEGSTGWGSAP